MTSKLASVPSILAALVLGLTLGLVGASGAAASPAPALRPASSSEAKAIKQAVLASVPTSERAKLARVLGHPVVARRRHAGATYAAVCADGRYGREGTVLRRSRARAWRVVTSGSGAPGYPGQLITAVCWPDLPSARAASAAPVIGRGRVGVVAGTDTTEITIHVTNATRVAVRITAGVVPTIKGHPYSDCTFAGFRVKARTPVLAFHRTAHSTWVYRNTRHTRSVERAFSQTAQVFAFVASGPGGTTHSTIRHDGLCPGPA